MELKVNPRKDALIGPAMKRFSVIVRGSLSRFKSGSTSLDVLRTSLQNTLEIALVLSVERGYKLAIQAAAIPRYDNELTALRRAAKKRARIAAGQIAKTSKSALEVHAAITKENVSSKKRSEGIVEYEMPRMVFLGMRKGWDRITGSRQPTKRWYVISDNPCEACIENEDEGAIPLDDEFPSGDMDPPGHPHCDCIEGLHI